jgi:hypothetical protein
MSIITNIHIPARIDGDIASMVLIIFLSISFLLSNSKYWSVYVSNTLKIFYNTMLWIFIAIVIFKIMITIKKL